MDFYGPFPHLRTKRTTYYRLENDIFDGVEAARISYQQRGRKELLWYQENASKSLPDGTMNSHSKYAPVKKSKTICAMPKRKGVLSVISSLSIHKYKTIEKDEIKTVPFDSISDQRIWIYWASWDLCILWKLQLHVMQQTGQQRSLNNVKGAPSLFASNAE